jgi:hypothetical protein
MNAGPGFFFMALEQRAGFVSQSALVGFAATGGVLAFVALRSGPAGISCSPAA